MCIKAERIKVEIQKDWGRNVLNGHDMTFSSCKGVIWPMRRQRARWWPIRRQDSILPAPARTNLISDSWPETFYDLVSITVSCQIRPALSNTFNIQYTLDLESRGIVPDIRPWLDIWLWNSQNTFKTFFHFSSSTCMSAYIQEFLFLYSTGTVGTGIKQMEICKDSIPCS